MALFSLAYRFVIMTAPVVPAPVESFVLKVGDYPIRDYLRQHDTYTFHPSYVFIVTQWFVELWKIVSSA